MRALIFDFDGTILDTEMPEFLAWEAIYHEHGVLLPRDRWLETIGLAAGTAEWHPLHHLEDVIGPLDREAIRSRQRTAFHAFVEAEPLRPGVAAYLESARSAGVRVGLASSATRDWIDWNLSRLGLDHHFECRFTREDVVHAKPHPELYLKACATLRAEPSAAAAIEDSVNGIRAAKAAGMFCVATPNPLTRLMDLSHADLHVASLEELPLSELIARVRKGREGGPAHRT